MKPRVLATCVLMLAASAPAFAQTKPQLPAAAPAATAAPAVKAAPAELKKLSEGMADVAEKVSPSVVQVEVTVANDSATKPGEAGKRGVGSGVIFSADGAVLTNNHVIEDAKAVSIKLKDGRVFAATLAGRDPQTDLAVLKIDAKNLPTVTFADSDAARVGEIVLAIGSPLGLSHTVTMGVLSAKGRGGANPAEDYLQTDASINAGNSGGPLVNIDGKVLGINTQTAAKAQGISLSVPANMAKRVAEQLLKNGKVDRAWMGVGLQDVTPQLAAEIAGAPSSGGALVNAVTNDSPAAKAHLEPGDILTSIGGKNVKEAQDIIREVFQTDPGKVLTFEVIRAGKKYQTKVTLESRKDPAPATLPMQRQVNSQGGFGITLAEKTDPSNAKQTLTEVGAVATDTPADRAGLKAGDTILEVDGIKMPTKAQVTEASKDGHMLMRLKRGSASFYVALKKP
ncbi:MAG: trypsin-like peptidase domain-containing protein [Polyangiaceae bacterium]|nr:trypsin-like peptidase domain-containing protein [Polyangiaceae bacterium]